MELREFGSVKRNRKAMAEMTGIVSGEKNRMHKVLTDGGIRLAVVVA